VMRLGICIRNEMYTAITLVILRVTACEGLKSYS
jgi:hypothetical protein